MNSVGQITLGVVEGMIRCMVPQILVREMKKTGPHWNSTKNLSMESDAWGGAFFFFCFCKGERGKKFTAGRET